MTRSLVFSITVLAAFSLVAHGDIHQQIAILTEHAGDHPGIEQLLERAELRRLDGNFLEALADCELAFQRDKTNARTHFVRGKILIDKQKYEKAAIEFSEFLKVFPDHSEALLCRARCFVSVDEPTQAQRDFRRALHLAHAAQPDDYIEFAKLLRSTGQGKMALEVVEEGIRSLGRAVSLQLFALELEMEEKDYDGALKRVDEIMSQAQRKEQWLARRGEILEAAGRYEEATRAFDAAIVAWRQLPSRFRSTESMQQLKSKMELSLQRLKH